MPSPLPAAAAAAERLGSSISEPSLSTRDALDKYQIVSQKVALDFVSLFLFVYTRLFVYQIVYSSSVFERCLFLKIDLCLLAADSLSDGFSWKPWWLMMGEKQKSRYIFLSF